LILRKLTEKQLIVSLLSATGDSHRQCGKHYDAKYRVPLP
jgi:hypothetical protein